tara:strand:- start:3159 stop:5648 length:2490 start_codon:yes stop_codon:yes gene_type:complete
MAEAQRFVIALVAGALFLSSLPFISAELTDETDLFIEISNSEISRTYIEGEIVEIESVLVNNGESVIFEENPSCEVYMTVKDNNNVIVYSNLEQCREQSRSALIEKDQMIQQTTQKWNFRTADDKFVDSGKYTITISHSKMDLNDSLVVDFVKKSIINENIQLKVVVNQVSTIDTQEAYLAQVVVKNSGTEIIELENTSCLILISNLNHNDEIKSCFGETKLLHPNENIYSGHVLMTNHQYDFSFPTTFQIYGSENTLSVTVQNSYANISNINDADYSNNVLSNWNDISIYHFVNQDKLAIVAEIDQQNPPDLSESCNASITVFNDYGELFYNDDFYVCHFQEQVLDDEELSIFEWELLDEQMCYISIGRYSVVLQIEDALFSFDFNQNKKNTNTKCLTNTYEVDFESILTENSIFSSIDVRSISNTLRIDSECLAVVKVSSAIENYFVEEFCGYSVGNFFTLENDSLSFFSQTPLENLNSLGVVEVKLSSIMGQQQTHLKQFNLKRENTAEHINNLQLDGIWENIQYGQNECWLLNSPNSANMVDASELTTQWRPKDGWFGSYTVTSDERFSENCGVFGIPLVEIKEIFEEYEPYSSTEPLKSEEIQSNEIDVVAITLTGTASASILVTLVLLISNTESMRIPLTSAGLWMLALVGKTHETSDGRFQRGRLIGYLTANPGCHFRALMAALKMSNGQITHHLRLLENQELIWRINDGRFVRYYPLNNSLYPGMNPDDLPVPPLSPDPKSLQGKILTLLDDEHQIGEFPTQSELAKKLEKSQQLISHHLRTLQKYGLVEKRKMGIKNRYKLTKEALFLLETDIDFNKVRD